MANETPQQILDKATEAARLANEALVAAHANIDRIGQVTGDVLHLASNGAIDHLSSAWRFSCWRSLLAITWCGR